MTLNTARPLLAFCLPLLSLACSARPTGGWERVGGPLQNVSGMARVPAGPEKLWAGQFLVVHDNKNPGEPRVASVRIPMKSGVAYTPLPWPGDVEPPVDLEAICAVPGTPGSFLAMTSAGRLLHLRYEGAAAERPLDVLHESMLPGLKKEPNLEGFAVQSLGGKQVAVWADRGDGEQPGVLYWGLYDPVADVVSLHGKTKISVPYPRGQFTRHLADVKVDEGGVVWATSSVDPGDQGPYESVLYALGALHLGGEQVSFQENPSPVRLWHTRRKVEALELVPDGSGGGVYFGADDEAAGGWLYVGRRERIGRIR